MKSICFHCQFVGVGLADTRCPRCSYPLITNLAAAALGTQDLEVLFASTAKHTPPPLPGLSAEPRQAQLLMQRRREKALARLEARRAIAEAEKKRTRQLAVASWCAASAAVALGLLLTLNVMGAL